MAPLGEPSGNVRLLNVAVQHDIARPLAEDVRLCERVDNRSRALCGVSEGIAGGEQFQNRRIIWYLHLDALHATKVVPGLIGRAWQDRYVIPYRPMRLLRVREVFDDPDFIFELKLDGFRGLAFLANGRCQLVSRNGHVFSQWDSLKREIASSLACRSAVVDGEFACLDPDGRSNF
jgi:ATP-dependent DNA ligase